MMICGACGEENSIDSKFCEECGTVLLRELPTIPAKKYLGGYLPNRFILSTAGTLTTVRYRRSVNEWWNQIENISRDSKWLKR